MLIMVEKVIGGGICYSIYQYAETNKKMHERLSSYFQYCDINNL